jgi:acyl-CoA reductase-like NAD-dependent aldehyde dehydrogenase
MTTIQIHNPASGLVVRQIQAASISDVTQAVHSARQMQPIWASRPLAERAAIVGRFAQLLEQRTDHLALTLSTETGKPIAQARGEIAETSRRIRYFIEHVERTVAPRLVYQDPDSQMVIGTANVEEVVTYDALGVVANISAWNYPYFVGSNVFAPALLTGNAVIYKPSEFATLTGLAITGLLHEAGVPPEIFSVVVGDGRIGQAVIDAGIDGVFFTGSYGTGVRVAAAAAPHLMRVQLELGGKDPAYVTDDVEPRNVASALADGAFYNSGQSCCAVERIYIHHSVYYDFRAAFVEAVKGFTIGDPSLADTYIGPLTREAQLSVLEEQVADAVDKGATVLLGGKRIPGKGWYFEPTVLADVNHTMKVMTEESFGPIIGLQRVQSDAEAIELMQDTPYGLTASVYSAARDRATAILQAVPSGTSYWNCCDRVSPRLPWTGRGHSGIGSTLSREGIQAFIQPRGWHLKRPS